MPRFDIEFRVATDTQTITAVSAPQIRAGSRNYWYAVFSIDGEMSDLQGLTASFSRNPYKGGARKAYMVPIVDGECQIPWEALTKRGTVYVGLFGGDLMVTNEAEITVTYAAPTMGDAPVPHENWYDELLEVLANTKPTFPVTVEETPIADIVAAYQAHILPVIFTGEQTFYCNSVGGGYANFYALEGDIIYEWTVNGSNEWTYREYDIAH
jgi:hypothetical protein